MIWIQIFLTFARSTIGRYVLAGGFGLMTALGVYYGIKSKIRADLQRDAVVEQQRRVQDAIDSGNSVPDDPERLQRDAPFRKWCRDC